MSPNPFVGRWMIKDWKEGHFPAAAFEAGKTVLDITAAGGVFTISWHDGTESLRSMGDLEFNEGTVELRKEGLSVDFGEPNPRLCNVTVKFLLAKPCKIICVIELLLGDGNPGTFAADAHPGIDGSA